MKTFQVLGRKVKAHNALCASSFREDRKHGLIYPAIFVEGMNMNPMTAKAGVDYFNREEASMEWDFCVYCGE